MTLKNPFACIKQPFYCFNFKLSATKSEKVTKSLVFLVFLWYTVSRIMLDELYLEVLVLRKRRHYFCTLTKRAINEKRADEKASTM